MYTEISGALSWVFNICVMGTAMVIIIMGTWCIFNFVLWEWLVRPSMTWLKSYSLFIHFIRYRKRYYEWAKKYEGKIEPGAND